MLQRRDLLRLLAQATTLALLAFGAEGCGGGSKNNDNGNDKNNMAEDDLSNRLTTVRRLLDDAEQKLQSVSDPQASVQLSTQIAIGNAVLVIAERVSELSGISDHTRDINDSIKTHS